MRRYKKYRRILAAALIASISFTMLCTPVLAAKDRDVSNAFAADYEDFIADYYDMQGWDYDSYRSLTWTGQLKSSGIGGTINSEDITYERRTGYQEEYLSDLIYTTAQYLDISISGYGSGSITASQAITMLAQREANIAAVEADNPQNVTCEVGSDNNVKYNTWYYGHTVSGAAYMWCAVFVAWCAEQCGLIDTGTFPNYSQGAAGVANVKVYFDNKGYEKFYVTESAQWGGDKEVSEGDIVIFYDKNGKYIDPGESKYTHIGIVVGTTEDTITLVEGNSSNKVSQNDYTKVNCYREDFYYGIVYKVEYPSNANIVYNYLTGSIVGMSPQTACGLMGCMRQESGMVADKQEIGSYSDGEAIPMDWSAGSGYGLIQWTNTTTGGGYATGGSNDFGSILNESNPGRRDRLIIYCKENNLAFYSYKGQASFIAYELPTYYGVSIDSLTFHADTTGVKAAARWFLAAYISGQGTGASDERLERFGLSNRQGYALEFWEEHDSYAAVVSSFTG